VKFSTSGFKSKSTNYDSWNKTKDKLTADEYNKRRRLNACINCGEVGHIFFECPKPKPRLFESVINSAIHITRTPISELPIAINESCVIKLNSDYQIDYIEHHLKNAFELDKNIGCDNDTSLTSIEALNPNLGSDSKGVSIPLNKGILNLA